MKKLWKILITDRNIGHVLFWSWNLIFLAFMLFGFAPIVLPEILTAVRVGDIPSLYLFYGTVLALIPLAALLLGWFKFRRQPSKLLKLGYGVEGPLMLLLAFRFFVIRQMTPQIGLLLLIAAIGIGTFFWELIDGRIEKRHPILLHGRIVGLTFLLVIGVYVSLLIAFYAVPFGYGGIRGISEGLTEFFRTVTWAEFRNWFNIDWSRIEWRYLPLSIFGFTLLVYTATLFVAMPIAISVLYVRAWWRGVLALVKQYSQSRAGLAVTAVFLTLIAAFIITDSQPQHKAFALLEEAEQTSDIIASEAQIRRGLLNAYLSRYRYISAQGDVIHIHDIYTDLMEMDEEKAQQVQTAYEQVARPLLYRPVEPLEPRGDQFRRFNQVLIDEADNAAELYELYFDEPITEGEEKKVVDAVRTSWDVTTARAGWQAVADREILLTHQEVNISEHGDWAEVELYEVYQNQTAQRQEVVYYFSLPETAVLTGVWLGESDDRDERFVYQVAPRGAAQQVYQEQVQRRIDPALLEQIGPSQYRLRVFPVLPIVQTWDNTGFGGPSIEDAPPMHMWLTYEVMAEDGAWPLPHLARGFNVYWENDSVRLINGEEVRLDEETWLPETVAAQTAVSPTSHRVDFDNGMTLMVSPISEDVQLETPTDLNIAVVLDRSRSMASLNDAVEETLAEIAALGISTDVILTASAVRDEAPTLSALEAVDSENIVYFGGQNATELMIQFNEVANASDYDAIFVLTDGTGYDVGPTDLAVPAPEVPVWMVHLNGRFPLGYDDDTLDALLASGGGTVGSFEEGLTRYLRTQANQTEGVWTDEIDGYMWTTVPTEILSNDFPSESTFSAIAARRLIQSEQIANRGTITELETLDALHDIAVKQGIVTPYSSMIVLVNIAQQNRLDALSDDADRFEREFEEIGETDPLLVTGVPEPEEWLLIFLMVGMLIYVGVKNGRIPLKRMAL